VSAAGDQPAVAFRDVDIVFGRTPERALPLLDAGRSREQILAATGQVLGVAGASLEVGKGEICVLMGLSGSGKSTLLRAVNRLCRPVRGEVLVEDQGRAIDVLRCDEATLRRLRMTRIAMVFQQFALLPWRTVAENVGFGLELRGVAPPERARAVRAMLELVHLEAWADKHAHELSGGMQQRVGLARAFATDADILLMDEPFSALDPLIRDRLQDELLELQRKLRKTIVFVSHDLDEALKIGTTIAIMEGGRIVQAGAPEAIVTRPATDYVRAFIANVNPLNVLSLASIMRPLAELARVEGEALHVEIDARVGLHARLDGDGRVGRLDGGNLPLLALDGLDGLAPPDLPCDRILLGRAGQPIRAAIDAIRLTGWPVPVVDGEGRLIGAVGIDEILACLQRRPR
jgi:glycine betaine/proline transport system ATP-binding protein